MLAASACATNAPPISGPQTTSGRHAATCCASAAAQALDRPRIDEEGVEVEPEIAMVAGLVAEVAARRHGGACGPIEQDVLDIREHVH